MNCRTVVLACASLCAAGQACAAEWSVAPRLSWTMDHDSNRLVIEDERASQSGKLQLDLFLKRATPTTLFTLQPHVGWQRYTNGINQNTNNQSLSAAGTWVRDRSRLAAQASWSRDDTLNNEIEETGAFTGTTQRRTKLAALSWTAEQSSLSQFHAQLSFSDVEYQYERFFTLFGVTIPVRSLHGYQYPSISLTQTHLWSDRSSVQLSGYAGRLISTGDTPDSDSYGVDAGWDHALTARIKLFISAGVSRQGVSGRNQDGYIGRLEVTRQEVLGQWRLFARRSVAASGYGYLVTQDEAGVSFERRMTPRWNGLLSMRSFLSEDITLDQRRDSRRYERAEAALSWRAAPAWQLRGAVAFARARRSGEAPLSDGWSTLLQAVWSPQPRAMSR